MAKNKSNQKIIISIFILFILEQLGVLFEIDLLRIISVGYIPLTGYYLSKTKISKKNIYKHCFSVLILAITLQSIYLLLNQPKLNNLFLMFLYLIFQYFVSLKLTHYSFLILFALIFFENYFLYSIVPFIILVLMKNIKNFKTQIFSYILVLFIGIKVLSLPIYFIVSIFYMAIVKKLKNKKR